MSKPSNRPDALAARARDAEIGRHHGCSGAEVSLLRLAIGLWIGNTGLLDWQTFRDLADEVFAEEIGTLGIGDG